MRDEHVERGLARVAVDASDAARGFYVLKVLGERGAELDLLFVALAHAPWR